MVEGYRCLITGDPPTGKASDLNSGAFAYLAATYRTRRSPFANHGTCEAAVRNRLQAAVLFVPNVLQAGKSGRLLEIEMELQEESRGELLIIRVCGQRIDASKAPQFKDEISQRIARGHTKLLLDFSMVEFIDSTGLGALVTCLKRLGKGDMAIAGAKGAVSRLFALTRMDKVISLYPTVDAALAHKGA